jgi:hypothetical protein
MQNTQHTELTTADVRLVKTGDSRYDVTVRTTGRVLGTVRRSGGHRIGTPNWLGPLVPKIDHDGNPVERPAKFATRTAAVDAFLRVANGNTVR